MNVTVKILPQETEWQRSFNVFVPLSIQGKQAVLIKRGKSPNRSHGSINHQIVVDGRGYSVPTWAIVDSDGRNVKPEND